MADELLATGTDDGAKGSQQQAWLAWPLYWAPSYFRFAWHFSQFLDKRGGKKPVPLHAYCC